VLQNANTKKILPSEEKSKQWLRLMRIEPNLWWTILFNQRVHHIT